MRRYREIYSGLGSEYKETALHRRFNNLQATLSGKEAHSARGNELFRCPFGVIQLNGFEALRAKPFDILIQQDDPFFGIKAPIGVLI